MPYNRYKPIADDLRRDIFRSAYGDDLVLHENELAERFGVSRTPIRAVLQALASECLVETLPGVGTVAMKLDPRDENQAYHVFEALAAAASQVVAGDIPSEVRRRLIGLSSYLDGEERGDVDAYIEVSLEISACLRLTVTDKILGRALVASQWRALRYRVHRFHADPEQFWPNLRRPITMLADSARSGSASEFLAAIAVVAAGFQVPSLAEREARAAE